MIEKKQNEIINKIENLKEVKELKILNNKLKNNKKYNYLIKELQKENIDKLKIRKQLFEIEDYKKYNELYINIKLLFIQINKIIISLVDNKMCKK